MSQAVKQSHKLTIQQMTSVINRNQQKEGGNSRCRYECPRHGSKDDRKLEQAALEKRVRAAVVHIYLEQDDHTSSGRYCCQ
jgi:hypothetical protein